MEKCATCGSEIRYDAYLDAWNIIICPECGTKYEVVVHEDYNTETQDISTYTELMPAEDTYNTYK